MSLYRLRSFLILALLIVISCSVCFGLERLVEPQEARKIGLQINWETKFPLSKSEDIKDVYVLGRRIYVISNKGYMVAMSRKNGNIIFSRYLSRNSLPVLGLGLHDDILFSVVGNELLEMGTDFGADKGRMRIPFGVEAPVKRNDRFYYFCASDKRLKGYTADKKVLLLEVAADDTSHLTTVYADNEGVIFGTASGYLVRIQTDEPKRIWEFKASDKIIDPVAVDENSVIFASEDTNVYHIRKDNGDLVWKYQTPDILEYAPAVTDKVVYQFVDNTGLLALDRKTGQKIWKMQEGRDLLAEIEGKAYIINRYRNIVVMDNEKKEQVDELILEGISVYHTNTEGNTIYITDREGRIASLKPLER